MDRATARRAVFSPHGLFVASLVLHLAVVLVVGHFNHPILWENGAIADSMYNGRGFAFGGQLTSWQAPGYPYSLLFTYEVFGQTTTAYLILSVLQALAVASLVYPIGWLTRRWFNNPTAVTWAMVIVVFMPLYLWYPTRIHQTAFVMALAPWLVAGWLSLKDRATPAGILLTGAGTGLLGLFQPVLLAPLGVIAAVFAVRYLIHRDWKRLVSVAVAGALTVLVLVPWTVRNYDVHGRLLLVKDSLGKEFWVGNNPHANGTANIVGGAQEITQAFPPEAYKLRGKVPEIEFMDATGQEAIEYVKDEPGEFVKTTLKRVAWFWTLTPPKYSRSTGDAEAKTFAWVHAAYWFAFVGLMVVARIGAPKWKREYTGVMVAFIATSTLVYGLTIVGQARFRGEIEFIFIPAVAMGLTRLVSLVRKHESPSASSSSQAEPSSPALSSRSAVSP